MNLVEEWFDSRELYLYSVNCHLCGSPVTVYQRGKPLKTETLKKIIQIVHVDNTFEALQKYELVDGQWVCVDVEIEQECCTHNA